MRGLFIGCIGNYAHVSQVTSILDQSNIMMLCSTSTYFRNLCEPVLKYKMGY